MTRHAALVLFIGLCVASCNPSSSDDPAPAPQDAAKAEAETPSSPSTPPDPPEVREATATEVRAEPVSIELPAPKAGDTRIETLKIRLERVLEATEGGKTEYSKLDERHEFQARVEIVEVGESGATQAKVLYTSRTDEEPKAEKATRLPAHPVTDKAYLLSKEGARVGVTYEDGTKPPAMETRAVLDSSFAAFDGRFAALLPTGELKPDEQFELDEAKVAPLLEARPRRGQDLQRGLLTYRGLADVDGATVAVFALDAQLQRLEGILRTTMTLRGELLFDPKTGRLVRATLQGPMSIDSETGAHGGAMVKGQGAMTVDAEVAPSNAPPTSP